MNNFIKYLSWNIMLISILVCGSFFKLGVFITVLEIFYGFELFCNIFLVFTAEGISKKNIIEIKKRFKWYKMIGEVFCIIIAFICHQYLIMAYMAASMFLFIYILASAKEEEEMQNEK